MQRSLSYKGHEVDIDGPICNLPREVIWPLAANLSIPSPVDLDGRGGDWRDLAGYIRLPITTIDLIEDSGGKTKAFTLLKLWDRGIKKNRGTVRKLMVALHEAGFGDSFLKDFMLKPLLGDVDHEGIKRFISSLQSQVEECMFPHLELNDIVWDPEIEDCTLHVCDDEIIDDQDELPNSAAQVDENNIYISYFTKSRSNTYKRQVKNMIHFFENFGYDVFHEGRKQQNGDVHAQKEKWIKSSANIIVVFNKEYQYANDAFLNKRRLPPCLATDIPLISHIFRSDNNGSSRIIPVVIDRCRTQPAVSDFPVWLTGTPRRLFPSQSRLLLSCIQGVAPRVVRSNPKNVRIQKPIVIDGDEVRRRFIESNR